jgi:hypothetical protein
MNKQNEILNDEISLVDLGTTTGGVQALRQAPRGQTFKADGGDGQIGFGPDPYTTYGTNPGQLSDPRNQQS